MKDKIKVLQWLGTKLTLKHVKKTIITKKRATQGAMFTWLYNQDGKNSLQNIFDSLEINCSIILF